MTAKRVLLVVPAFPRVPETFIVSKFVGLVDRGFDVHVWCGRTDERDWQAFPSLAGRRDLRERVHASAPTQRVWRTLVDGPRVTLRDLGRSPARTARYVSRAVASRAWRAIEYLYLDGPLVRLAPEIVHFEFGSKAVERSYLFPVIEGKVVVSFRGADICLTGLDRPDFYDDVWSRADAFHFLGEDLRRVALGRGCPADRMFRFIPPAIDVDAFAGLASPYPGEVGTASRPIRLVSVARLEWKKGHEHMLDAVARLVRRGIHVELRIVGSGVYEQAIRFARKQLNLENQVTLVGAIPASGVREQLAWADVFVHSALSEGYCNAVIEAQAAGLPIVTSDAEGLRENVADGETGFVVTRRDPDAMSDKIEQLARDAQLRRRMALAGPPRARRLFRLERQLDQWAELYNEVSR